MKTKGTEALLPLAGNKKKVASRLRGLRGFAGSPPAPLGRDKKNLLYNYNKGGQ